MKMKLILVALMLILSTPGCIETQQQNVEQTAADSTVEQKKATLDMWLKSEIQKSPLKADSLVKLHAERVRKLYENH